VARRDAAARLAAVQALVLAAQELADLLRPGGVLDVVEVDPRTPLRDAAARWRARVPSMPLHLEEPTVMLPTMLLDARWLTRGLELAIGLALRTLRSGGSVLGRVTVGRGFLALHVRWDVAVPVPQPHPESLLAILEDASWEVSGEPQLPAGAPITAVDVALLRTIVRRLGGELRVDAADQADGPQGTLVLLFPVTEPQ
jgi:hypothetical protein